jgi:D-2-hydroxyacid dehydrogenase (NADP+)
VGNGAGHHDPAGVTDRYADRVVDIFVENMKAYLESGTPSLNLVDYSRQY